MNKTRNRLWKLFFYLFDQMNLIYHQTKKLFYFIPRTTRCLKKFFPQMLNKIFNKIMHNLLKIIKLCKNYFTLETAGDLIFSFNQQTPAIFYFFVKAGRKGYFLFFNFLTGGEEKRFFLWQRREGRKIIF